MKIIADLHVHSKYSRATSKALNPAGLAAAAKQKGIDIVATGDFTHPVYLQELKDILELDPATPGLFVWGGVHFILSTEIACIYTDRGQVRRNHIVILVPDFETVDQLISALGPKVNLKSDGRPILGLSSEQLAGLVFKVNPDNLVIPAHIWTPWFSTFGSKSGYDSLAECFGASTGQILAIETGLSSDPLMNWQVPELDDFAIISSGDAHSPGKVGREATVFELAALSYANLRQALQASARLDPAHLPPNYIKQTIEFYPEEGKYHWDGHRGCDVSFSPSESQARNNLCPKCRKPLVLGVAHRVADLAKRNPEEAADYGAKCRPGCKKIVPLMEVIAETLGVLPGSKKVNALYQQLISDWGSEFFILLELDPAKLAGSGQNALASAIIRMRSGELVIQPGYDGVFGKIAAFSAADRQSVPGAQSNLF